MKLLSMTKELATKIPNFAGDHYGVLGMSLGEYTRLSLECGSAEEFMTQWATDDWWWDPDYYSVPLRTV